VGELRPARRWPPIPCDQSNEHCIKKRLFAGHRYDRETRPVRNDLTTTSISIGISVYHILDTVHVYWLHVDGGGA